MLILGHISPHPGKIKIDFKIVKKQLNLIFGDYQHVFLTSQAEENPVLLFCATSNEHKHGIYGSSADAQGGIHLTQLWVYPK